MDPRLITLCVALVTVCANLIFALTGVTHSLSCTVARAGHYMTATALAAMRDDTVPLP